jgi:molybdate transport system regulatory protein
MNQLTAIIKRIETEENISLVAVEADSMSFTTLVIDTPATAGYLREGNEVMMVFKETAMSIAKNLSGSLSIRNRFPGTITSVKSGKVLTAISLLCKGNPLTSVITTHAANDLALAVGDTVEGLVKTNDISLMQKE